MYVMADCVKLCLLYFEMINVYIQLASMEFLKLYKLFLGHLSGHYEIWIFPVLLSSQWLSGRTHG
jgi:hypothetical protein